MTEDRRIEELTRAVQSLSLQLASWRGGVDRQIAQLTELCAAQERQIKENTLKLASYSGVLRTVVFLGPLVGGIVASGLTWLLGRML